MKTYRAIYRLEFGGPNNYRDVELVADHCPDLGCVCVLPDGSGRYGRVISIERVRPTTPHPRQPGGLT